MGDQAVRQIGSPASAEPVITITSFVDRHFPRICCGTVYKGPRSFMEHFLPAHMAVQI